MRQLLHNNRGVFKRAMMDDEEVVKNFSEIYDYADRVEALLGDRLQEIDAGEPIDEQIVLSEKVTYDSLQESFLLGYDNILLDFGLIGPVNWLLIVKKIHLDVVLDKVADSLLRLYGKPELKRVFELTERYSPYPDWFVFQSCGKMFDRLKQKYSIELHKKFDVAFTADGGRWSF
jgi:hypothetical protein